MTSERSGREVANQFIITDGRKTLFQSYDSPIVEIDRIENIITVYRDWDYSMTTGKYRNQFMSNEGFSAMASKKGFEEYLKIGEIKGYKIVKEF
jgi:hypothetical protein